MSNEALVTGSVLKQHVIDPEICIRCNTCEAICPTGAVTHDSRNYVVKPDLCNGCMACVPPCPTGSIDNWRSVLLAKPYTVEEQLGWDELPEQLEGISDMASSSDASVSQVPSGLPSSTSVNMPVGSTIAPHSAAKPETNLYGSKLPITAKVTGNHRVTALGTESDTHHIVLDFGTQNFPVLEGQSLGIIPPGVDASGRAHHPRQYSIASPRSGERKGYNNLSLTIKRVLQDHDGKPVRGVGSNYMCDLKVGDEVQVTGPFGTSFLMPNHAGSNIVMICTGTGSAPMRAMTEWRRRERLAGTPNSGKLMLFFGARTKEELPYFGPLQNLPKDFIDIHFAFSRAPDPLGHGSKRYVQDVMREEATQVAALLKDANTYFYVCGLKSMEAGVLDALKDIAASSKQDWSRLSEEMRVQGRLHLETY